MGHSPEEFAGRISDVRDDMLRILFACCDDSLPIEAQLVLALKVLCGFDVREIAVSFRLACVIEDEREAHVLIRDLAFPLG